MIIPINLERLSGDGYKMNANNPTASTPSYITHAQLRYSPFTSSEAIQGAFVTGAYSTVEFDVTGANLTRYLKLYTSTDGTTYNEVKSWGGTDGIRQKEYRLFSSRLTATNIVSQQIAVNELDTVSSISYSAFDAQIVIVFASNIFATDYKTDIGISNLSYLGGLKNANFNFTSTANTLTIYGINPANGNALSFSASELIFTLEIKIYP